MYLIKSKRKQNNSKNTINFSLDILSIKCSITMMQYRHSLIFIQIIQEIHIKEVLHLLLEQNNFNMQLLNITANSLNLHPVILNMINKDFPIDNNLKVFGDMFYLWEPLREI
jgi:hypothetical protein